VFTAYMTQTQTPNTHGLTVTQLSQIVAKRSYCTLATSSAKNRPHNAGLIYASVGLTLYVSTARSSHKARNIAANPHVGVVIPVRRLPVGGPPSAVQYQGTAELLALDDPQIVELVEAGRLKAITSHGELDHPDGCFLRITPGRRINTYGLGMSLIQLIRHPLEAGGSIDLTGGER
jgi:general stress protein 26